jgi:hypothetical protein
MARDFPEVVWAAVALLSILLIISSSSFAD